MPLGSGIGGKPVLLETAGTSVFVKRVPSPIRGQAHFENILTDGRRLSGGTRGHGDGPVVRTRHRTCPAARSTEHPSQCVPRHRRTGLSRRPPAAEGDVGVTRTGRS
ncbi:hypothetical protein GCM10017559_53800 [Streptosporangium longisporum]|uniref:Aminoglycoside phosphotransferase domain-containing protein n=1 Tax=Streptosporangium longisporum TaxID=46187 RepID=A0ABP6KR34_9ACTN